MENYLLHRARLILHELKTEYMRVCKLHGEYDHQYYKDCMKKISDKMIQVEKAINVLEELRELI
jgi:hypothetical protein